MKPSHSVDFVHEYILITKGIGLPRVAEILAEINRAWAAEWGTPTPALLSAVNAAEYAYHGGTSPDARLNKSRRVIEVFCCSAMLPVIIAGLARGFGRHGLAMVNKPTGLKNYWHLEQG
jgi:hypothetical protein